MADAYGILRVDGTLAGVPEIVPTSRTYTLVARHGFNSDGENGVQSGIVEYE